MICLKSKAKAPQQQNRAASQLAPQFVCEVYLLPICLSFRHPSMSADKGNADKAVLSVRQAVPCAQQHKQNKRAMCLKLHQHNSTNSTIPQAAPAQQYEQHERHRVPRAVSGVAQTAEQKSDPPCLPALPSCWPPPEYHCTAPSAASSAWDRSACTITRTKTSSECRSAFSLSPGISEMKISL